MRQSAVGEFVSIQADKCGPPQRGKFNEGHVKICAASTSGQETGDLTDRAEDKEITMQHPKGGRKLI